MAMTTDVKDELSRVIITKMSTRKAEVATVLRFAGGLHIIHGRVAVEAELDSEATTRRVCAEIGELYGHRVHVRMLAASGTGKGTCYMVQVTSGGDALARQTGLLDLRGRPVLGLPAQIVAGSVTDIEGVWRGAFLAAGSLTEPGRPTSLEVTCPGPEAALALAGAARRLGAPAKPREFHGVHQVVVRDGDAISALLTRLGAHNSALTWGDGRTRREVRAAANRLANFDDANQLRAARAAAAASARVKRALEILAADAPNHLAEAGKLRMEHPQASLEQLGQLMNPPMTKDAIAGRIRRLLTMADKRAGQDGIPDTESGIAPDLLN